MASTNPNACLVSCPSCGAQYDFPAAMAGKRGRCAQCGVAFSVPAGVEKPEPPDELPQYIGVECHVCGTRMYGGPSQVGQELKCPDCGARTVLPPPPKPKPKNIPAAMEGEQYELWEADVQPLSSELVAHQPVFIAVHCRKCDTLMYATEKQVGEKIACPDCGRTHVVPPPLKPAPKPSVLARAADTPMLDPAAKPGERPAIVVSTHQMAFEEQQEAAFARAIEKSKRTGKPMEIDSRGRPILPRWPLVTGVVPFLFSPGVPARWGALAAGFFGSLSIFIFGIETAASGGMGAIAGMCFFALGSGLTMICASAACSYFLAIVAESSDGGKQIQNWPSVFDWFGDFFAFAVAGMMSAFPGWAISQLILEDPLHRMLAIAGSMVVCFPVALLSQLDIGSMWAILSPRVLQSMLRCLFSWLTFYVETAAIVGASIVATALVAKSGLNPLMVAAPLGSAALFLYARLLGRLGWRLAEAMPEIT